MSFTPIGLTTAWHNSGEFWAQTWAAVARHPLLLLACSAVPAAERAYMLLQTNPIPRWKLTLLEAVLTVWRILLCMVAVWVTLTPERWKTFQLHFYGNDILQRSLQNFGAYLGKHLHVVLWELVLFTAAFLLLNYALVWIARGLARLGAMGEAHKQKAFVSVVRNLVLVPLGLVYLVELLLEKIY
ncbi:MAG TPA: hypothetical protein VHT28_06985 [Silvibacterium sp.]|nr:hypothetical protein [Silvibacterium sp.]